MCSRDALALGISPEKYYSMKGYKVVLSKQILLDDIAWIYCKSGKLGCLLEEKLKAELIEKYTSLYKEIYENNIKNGPCPSIHEYYQSWKLRGDNPQSYRLDEKEFKKVLKKTELVYFDRFRFNPRVDNRIRENKRYRELYYYYHFNKKVREKGNEIIEFKVTDEYIKLVRNMQDKMINELAYKGISPSCFYNAVSRLRKRACQIPDPIGKASTLDLTSHKQDVVQIAIEPELSPAELFQDERSSSMYLDNSHTIEIEAKGLTIRMSNTVQPMLLKILMDALKEPLC